MLDPSRNTPTVARLSFVLAGPNRKLDSAADQIPGLLVWVRMPRQDSPFAHPELRHQGLVAMNECLYLDPVQDRAVACVSLFREHAGMMIRPAAIAMRN